jgi:type III secretion protein J
MRLIPLIAFSVIAATGCAKQEILHDLDERDANEIVVVLDQANPPVAAQKLPGGEGGSGANKGARFIIAVPAADANRAWKLLNDADLPRRKDPGYAEVFSQSGLIPTSSEEKAKTMQAITGELSRTLKSIDGVLDARVHVVMPEDSVLRTKEEDRADTTASVWYKYVPRGKNAQKPLTDQEIQDLVANSIEKLKPERVKVIATPSIAAVGTILEGSEGGSNQLERIMGVTVLRSDVNRFRYMMIGIVLAMVMLALVFTFALLRKSGVASAPARNLPRIPPDPSQPGA